MAESLVSLEAAKAHLRIVATDQDDDILRKAEQASGVIVDYLKSRAHRAFTITSSSVASPTVITTSEAHGYSTGDTATILGHEDSTPALDGSYVVTVLSTTTFSVPVNVTVAGSGGTVTVLWDTLTVPYPVQSAILLMLTHIHENRGEDMKADDALWAAVGRLLMRSRDPAFA